MVDSWYCRRSPAVHPWSMTGARASCGTSALTAGKTALTVVPERSSQIYPPLPPYRHWQGIRRTSARVPCGADRSLAFVTVLTGSTAGAARIALKSQRLAVGHCDPCAPRCGQILSSPTPVSTAASEASLAGRPARTSPASCFCASLNLSTSDNHVRNSFRSMPLSSYDAGKL